MSGLRTAVAADAAAINDIYNREVREGTATFDTEEMPLSAREAWLGEHAASTAHPVVVAEDAGAVTGWASLSAWSPRRAYDRTAEVSVYVHSSSSCSTREGGPHARLTDLTLVTLNRFA